MGGAALFPQSVAMSSATPLFFCESSARSIASKSMSVMQKVINGFLPIHDPSVITFL